MSSTEIVQSFYDALKRGDVPAVLALLSDDLAWTEAEGFPYSSGTWRTREEVFEKLLIPLSKDWENFSADAESFVSEADKVVAFGNYRGVNRATGRRLLAPFAHFWRVTDGRISRFIQYTDTVLVRKAIT